MPKVSVIIPTYNYVNFLRDAIESVLAQTHKDIEIIVVDDGSSDGTEELVKDYAGKVIYLRQENAGPAKARNVGILRATGEYLAFLDADDIWLPFKTEEQLKVFEDNPGTALVYSQAAIFNSYTGKERGVVPERVYQGKVFDALLSLTGPIILSSVMVRSSILKIVGVFDEALFIGEDINLWLRVAKSHKIAGIGKVLLWRRRHDKNISFQSEIPTHILDCLDKVVALFPEADPARYAPMRKAYLIHGRKVASTFFYHSKYGQCHDICTRLLGMSLLQPKLIYYWLLTLFPPPVLNTLRKGTIKDILDRRIHVLISENGEGPGGAFKVALELARNVDKNIIAPHILIPDNWPHYEALPTDLEIRAIYQDIFRRHKSWIKFILNFCFG